MIGVEVRVQTDNLERGFKRFTGKNPGLHICEDVAEDIATAARGLAPYWNHTLQNSIKTVPVKDGYNVEMIFYARFVDRGTDAHEVSANNYLFRAWALSKGIPWWAVRRSVALYGTKAHPFIQRSIDYGTDRIKDTSFTVINKMLKESGFK